MCHFMVYLGSLCLINSKNPTAPKNNHLTHFPKKIERFYSPNFLLSKLFIWLIYPSWSNICL